MPHDIIEADRLTIYTTETARHGGKPLFEWLLEEAMRQKMHGGTAHKALAGFGRHHHLHHEHILALSDDLPMVVTLIDTPDRIDAFINDHDALDGCAFTREKVLWHQPK